MMKTWYNRGFARTAVNFFDLCFKQGVLDACNFGDDYTAKDFLDQHGTDWTFGVLGEPDDFDWRMWRFTLYRWGRTRGFMRFSEEYIYRIQGKGSQWSFLPFCMRFYLMGIKEWLEYPNPTGIELFKKSPKAHWKPVPKGPKKMSVKDFIFYMQGFVFDYQRVPEEKREIDCKVLDAYCSAIYTLTRQYVKKR